jgi:hypothetical protein
MRLLPPAQASDQRVREASSKQSGVRTREWCPRSRDGRSTGCHLGPGAGDLPKRFRRKMIARPVACAQLLDAEGFVARRPTSRSERLSLGEGCRVRPCPSARPGSPRTAILCGFATRRADGAGHLMSKWQSSAPPSRATIHSSQSRSAALEPLALRAVRFPCWSILAARAPDPSNGLARVEKRQAACG